MEADQTKEAVKILVVDDQPGMRITLKGILTKKGYQVTVAEDGIQAIEAVKKENFRIIFMDVKMPGINGVEAFMKIKEINPKATVIMMTGFAVEEELKRAIQEGAYTVLYKPLDIEKILEVITECLGSQTLVLLVDDNLDDTELYNTILRQRGYKCVNVSTGEECLKQVKEKQFQIILLDVKLPGIDGVETLKQLKNIRLDVSVIMLTAYSKKQIIEEAMQHGSYACLAKPLDIEQLLDVLAQSLKSKTEQGENPH